MPNPPDRGRVPLVDALRGFALFGVVVSNMAIMLGAGAAGSEPSPLDTTVERVLATSSPAGSSRSSRCCSLAQVVWSRWWLTRFRIGPFEWIWRKLSFTV